MLNAHQCVRRVLCAAMFLANSAQAQYFFSSELVRDYNERRRAEAFQRAARTSDQDLTTLRTQALSRVTARPLTHRTAPGEDSAFGGEQEPVGARFEDPRPSAQGMKTAVAGKGRVWMQRGGGLGEVNPTAVAMASDVGDEWTAARERWTAPTTATPRSSDGTDEDGVGGGGTDSPATGSTAADLDNDGDVDLADFASFIAHFAGPQSAAENEAPVEGDLDGDGDVDLADFGVFQRGPGAGQGVGPVADAGGPYQATAADRVDGGWTFTFDGSASTPGSGGDAIVSWVWDFGADTFDGSALNLFKWDAFGALQDDAIVLTGHGSQWLNRVVSREPLRRANGASVEATVTPLQGDGYGVWGLPRLGGFSGDSDVEHGFYFYGTQIRIAEAGGVSGPVRDYQANVTYELRIELKEIGGARYWLREAGLPDWELLHDSDVGDAVDMSVGMLAYSGTYLMDDLLVGYAGPTFEHKVYAAGEVTLGIEDAAGATDTDTVPIDITGDALQADAGGPYVLDANDREGLYWEVTFDSGASTSTHEIVRAEWEFNSGVEPFDGTWLNTGRWESSRAIQDDRIEISGVGDWSAYVAELQPTVRINGAACEATVTPRQTDGYAIFGFKKPDDYDDHSIAHGFYFYHNGYIYVVENGLKGQAIRSYEADTAYSLRIELKEGVGARYWLGEALRADWELVADTGVAADAVLHRAVVAYGGRFALDDFGEVYHGALFSRNIYHGGPLTVTITDAVGRSDQVTTQITTVPAQLQSDAGGPYLMPEESATDFGLPLGLDGSASTGGPAIIQHRWDLGTEPFDGLRLDERKWVSKQTVQDDTLIMRGSGAWGTAYVYERDPAHRSAGQSVEARVRPGGYGTIGFLDDSAGVDKSNVVYGLYFALDELRVLDQGEEVHHVRALTSGQWYDIRINLQGDRGAGYWLRESPNADWDLVYASSSGTQTEFRRGAVAFNGTTFIDDWRQSHAGQIVDASVTGEGTVELNVMDVAGQTAGELTTYEIDGDGPVADAGPPIELLDADYTGFGWDVILDGSGATDDFGIVQYLWDPGVDSFGGLNIDVATWMVGNASQATRLVVEGGGTWGSGYAFDNRVIERSRGAFVEARVNSSGGHSMFGLRDAAANGFDYPTMVYAVNFVNDGRIRIFEDGNDRGKWADYEPGVDYDVRIELKDIGGARYLMRESGVPQWTPLYESDHSVVPELLGGCTVYDGALTLDDFRRSVSGETVPFRVRGAGTVSLTVVDAAFQTSTDTKELVLPGQPPIADAGGPYLVPLGSFAVLDASGTTASYDVASYAWDFGGGEVRAGDPTVRQYDELGTYQVTLTVTDIGGRTSMDAADLSVEPMVVAVPWGFDQRNGRERSHNVWSGLSARLKAVVFTDSPVEGLTYTWNFGGGSPVESGEVTDKGVIEAFHTYVAPTEALFNATVTVHDPVYGDLADTYPIRVYNQELKSEVNVAIEEGLWYLHKTQNAAGAWPSYGSYLAGSTASAVQALEINGHSPPRPVSLDPLVEDAIRGMKATFTYLTTTNISVQTYGDPDSNGNGIGIGVNSARPVYEGGMVMDAVAAGHVPDMMADTGVSGVTGRTYYGILRDMVDQYCWGQTDWGDPNGGGWRYSWNSDSDNSACQWAAIGMLGARDSFGLDAPGWVKDRNEVWLAYSRLDDGRYGYTGRSFCCGWYATTPSGLVQLAWIGVPTVDERWAVAEQYIADRWSEWRNSNNVYAYYAFVKAMRLAEPDPVEILSSNELEWDWYTSDEGLIRHILGRLQADGGWPDYYGRNFATAWQVIILTPTVFDCPPEAEAGENIVWACNLPLEFDGCDSPPECDERVLVQYEWDFDGDGNYDFSSEDCSAEYTYPICPPAGDPLNYQAALRVTDDIGQTAVDTRQVIIAHPPFAPIADAGGPYTAYVGIPFSPDAGGSFDIDPGDYISHHAWDFDGDDGYDFDNPDAVTDCPQFGECPAVAWVYDIPSSVTGAAYNIGLRVMDSGVLNPIGCTQGFDCIPLTSEPDFATVMVLENDPPVADAGGPYRIGECQTLQLDGSASVDPNGNPIYFSWDLDDDGEFDDADGVAPTQAWPEDGIFTISLHITDLGLEDVDETTVTVDDMAPSVSITGPAELTANQPGCFTATAVSPCDALGPVEWDWDYSVPPGFVPSGDTGVQQCHVYPEFGTYEVAVRAIDSDGDETVATMTVFVEPDIVRVRSAEHLLEVLYERHGYLPAQNQRYAEVSVVNVGESVVRSPIVVAFDELTPTGTFLVDPDGALPQSGLPYVELSDLLGDGLLDPGERSEPVLVYWQIVGDAELFSFVDLPYAMNSAPFFVTAPVLTATEGVLYRYAAQAHDADGDEVVYELVVSPETMAVSASTGLVKWTPGQMDAGVHDVVLRAVDDYGGDGVDQSFQIVVSGVNVAPWFVSTPQTTATPNVEWCYDVEVDDPDGDEVLLELLTGPDEMAFAPAGPLCWTPTTPGSYYVKLSAADATHLATQDFFLTVVACTDGALTIDSLPLLTATEGEPYEYQVTADKDNVAFSLAVKPLGMTIDAGTGLIAWTPGQQQGGPRVVKVVATDEGNALCRDEQVFEVLVAVVNVPPGFDTLPPTDATEGETYRYWANAIDPDGDVVVYGFISAPEDMQIDPDTGIIAWTPGQTAAADYSSTAQVTLAACDPLGSCSLQGFEIDIVEVNIAPRFTSAPVYSAVEGEEYVYVVETLDEDGDEVSVRLESIPDDPDSAEMSIDVDGVIHWTPSQTAGQSNPYPIQIIASDGFVEVAQTYEIFVLTVNLPPEVAAIPDQSLQEGDLLELQVQALDPDGDRLSFRRSSQEPNGMNVHPTTGRIEWPIGCDDAGEYTAAIEVSDGLPNGVINVEFDITVDPTNCGPIITSTPPVEAAVSHEYAYQIEAFDPEGGAVSCAIDEGPAGMSVDEGCLLTWTPGATGDELVRIVVSDEEARECSVPATWCQEYTINVVPCLAPPEIVSVPSETASVDNEYSYGIEADIGEPDDPAYEIVQGPAGMSVDANGQVTWSPTADQVGLHGVTVAVYTGLAECRAEQTFDVDATACSDPPVITSAGPTTADEATEYVYDVIAAPGAPGDMLTHQLATAPSGMTIDQETGRIRWTPGRADVGSYAVRIVVLADRLDCRAEQAYRLTVNRVDIAPTLVADCGSIAYAEEPYLCDVDAVDPNGDELRFSLITSITEPVMPPPGMSIDPDTGVMTWTPGLADVGMAHVGIRVDEVDGSGFDELEFDLGVIVNTPPQIVSNPPLEAVADATYTYDVDAVDVDDDVLEFTLVGGPATMTVDAADGTILWTPTPDDVGDHVVTVQVADGHDGQDIQTFALMVYPAGTNVAPVITSVAPADATPDCPYEYQVGAVDANGDVLACELVDAPDGMVIDPATCLISWLPGAGQLGDHTVDIRAYETETADGFSVNQAYTLALRSNAPPQFGSTPVTIVVLGNRYLYDADASDPDGDEPRYELLDGPADMMVNPYTGLVTWTPTSADVDPGGAESFYDVSIAANDARCGQAIQDYRLYVELDREPPLIDLTAPIALGSPQQVFPIVVTATDNVGVITLELRVNGELVNIGQDGTAWYESTAPGMYAIVATASDAAGNIAEKSARTIAIGEEESTPPVVQIISPADGSVITEPVDIIGTIQHENLAYWELSYRPASGGDDDYVLLAESTAEVLEPAVLANFDPTLLMNGLYEMRIYSLDYAGFYYTGAVSYLVDGNRKVGNFTVSFTDLSIPVAGLPIEIKRTYDSRNKTTGDFGVGWTLDAATVEVEEGMPLHEGWQATFIMAGYLPAYIILPTRAHMVNVRWPGGKNQAFLMNPPDRPIYAFEYLIGVDFSLEPVSGTPELGSDMDGLKFQDFGGYLGQGPFSGNAGAVYDPSSYELTAADGTQYSFAGSGRTAKLIGTRDRNGNRLDFMHDGIFHSSGKSILFQRDDQDRIVAMTDPNGNVMRYEYDERGDLVAYTDPEANVTRFDYNHEHGLTDITDPLGRRGIRNEYNDEGRLVAHIDANGNRMEYDRDIDARQEVVTDRLGNPTVHYYDQRGNVVLKTDAEGTSTEYEYDGRDNMLRETVLAQGDCPGREKTFTYDENNFVLTATSCTGGVTTYVRDSRGDVLQRIEPEGNVTYYTYDAAGNLLTEEAPDGGITRYAYDALGQEISVTNPLGFTEYFEYDDVSNLVARVDFAGARTEYAYDDNRNRTSETRLRTLPDATVEAIATRLEYDSRNHLIATTDAYGTATLTEYDAAGQRVATTDKLGHVTRYEYDVSGTLRVITYPDGSNDIYEYDAEEHRTATTDRNGHTARFEYNKLGRLTKTIHPDDTPQDPADNPYTETQYDCLGRITTQFDERRNPTTYEYPDCASQIVTDALGNSTLHESDLNNNRVRTVDALQHETLYEYDAMNRLTRTTYHDGTTAELRYDLAGRKTLEIDQAGKVTRYEHDPMDRLTAVILSSGDQDLATRYTYDELGNRLTQTDAEGRTTTFEYDKLSHRTEHILPMGQAQTSVYDAACRATAKTDFNGATIEYEYDENGRQVRETWPDRTTIEFEYLPGGQRTVERITKPNLGGDPIVTEVIKTYDERNRLKTASNPDGSSLAYEYDATGNRTSLTTSAGSAVRATAYTFDALNRPETVTDSDGGTTTYTYDDVGNRESVALPNGVVTAYGYDDLNRLTLLINKRPDDSIVSSYAYTLGPAGNRLRVDETTPDGLLRLVEYQYDGIYRLTAEIIDEPEGTLNADMAIAYTYDAVGNRLAKSVADISGVTTTAYTYDNNDRLLEEQTVFDDLSGAPANQTSVKTYTYDPNGNMLTRSLPAAADRYTYDYRNRLAAADNRTEDTSDVTFEYDADGMRTGKTVAGEDSTRYVVDKNRRYPQVLIETTITEADGSTSVANYVHADDLLSMTHEDADTSYYLYDGQMSTRQLTDSLAAVTDRYAYDAFGVDLYQTGTTANAYRYTGEQYDPNLGFYYLGARYYAQSQGRFVSSDPFSGSTYDPMSLHKYLYALANPIMNVDPTGMGAMLAYVLMLKCITLPMICLAGAIQCIAASLIALVAVVLGAAQVGVLPGGGLGETLAAPFITGLINELADAELSAPYIMVQFIRTVRKNINYMVEAYASGVPLQLIQARVALNCVETGAKCLISEAMSCAMYAAGIGSLLSAMAAAFVGGVTS